MAGMGPAPKPPDQRRRRNATMAAMQLPAEGRQGEPPAWPLPPDVRAEALLDSLRDEQAAVLGRIDAGEKPEGPLRAKLARLSQRIDILEAVQAQQADLEAELWRGLWRTPQSVAWERLLYTRAVAQYVRWKAKAELGDMDASKEARQHEDRLGLNPLSLRRLGWEIVKDEVAEHRDEKTTRKPTSRRRQMRIVAPETGT